MSFLVNNSKFVLSGGKFTTSSSAPAPTYINVTLVGNGSMTNKFIEYKGEKYYTNGSKFSVSIGDNIYFFIMADFEEYGVITINGTVVAEELFGVDYTWTVPSGISSIQINMSQANTIAVTTL